MDANEISAELKALENGLVQANESARLVVWELRKSAKLEREQNNWYGKVTLSSDGTVRYHDFNGLVAKEFNAMTKSQYDQLSHAGGFSHLKTGPDYVALLDDNQLTI